MSSQGIHRRRKSSGQGPEKLLLAKSSAWHPRVIGEVSRGPRISKTEGLVLGHGLLLGLSPVWTIRVCIGQKISLHQQ